MEKKMTYSDMMRAIKNAGIAPEKALELLGITDPDISVKKKEQRPLTESERNEVSRGISMMNAIANSGKKG